MIKEKPPSDCKRCGRPRVRNNRGKPYCSPCGKDALNRRRAQLGAAGLCWTCGKVSVAGTPHVYCPNCLERKRHSSTKQYAGRPEYACKTCGIALISRDFRNCPDCLAQMRANSAKAKQEGRCLSCKKRPAMDGYTACKRCRDIRQVQLEAKFNAGLCAYSCDCSNPHAKGKRWCVEHLEKNSKQNSVRRQEERERVIKHYGGCCACCGEHRYRFLAIDHVNGGGNKEIKQYNVLARVVIREGFPERFRILCHNCNMARGLYGACPHEAEGTSMLPAARKSA